MASDKERIAELEAQLKTLGQQHIEFQANVGAMMRDTIKDVLPLATMAAVQAMQAGQRQQNKVPAVNTERCHVCMQLKSACEGNHTLMYVGPRNQRRFDSFAGVGINSVWYKSPRYGVRIPVPTMAPIMEHIQRWEEGEEDLRNGRVMMHNSGTLSPTENNTVPANPYGFREMMPTQMERSTY